MSDTLKLLMKHWTDEIKPEGWVDLPFNIEEFCRENDSILQSSPPETVGSHAHEWTEELSVGRFRCVCGSILEPQTVGASEYKDEGPFVMSRYLNEKVLYEAMDAHIEDLKARLAESKSQKQAYEITNAHHDTLKKLTAVEIENESLKRQLAKSEQLVKINRSAKAWRDDETTWEKYAGHLETRLNRNVAEVSQLTQKLAAAEHLAGLYKRKQQQVFRFIKRNEKLQADNARLVSALEKIGKRTDTPIDLHQLAREALATVGGNEKGE